MPQPLPPHAPQKNSYKLIWQGTQTLCSSIADFMSEVHYPPAEAISLLKGDSNTADTASMWQIEAYFTEKPDLQAISGYLQDNMVAVPSPTLETIEPRDWVAHALEGLGIVTCGRFTLYGTHDAHKIEEVPEKITIRIDANQAFGTGHHPTTAGCLKMLDRYEGAAPQNILDLGTGSAVLAIAARKIWTGRILASDIDPVSVDIAKTNARLNDATPIEFITAAGFAHDTITQAGPFEFIFANILAGPLKELATDMALQCAKRGYVMLAGLLQDQELGVMQAYEQAGFTLLDRLADATWPVLLLQQT